MSYFISEIFVFQRVWAPLTKLLKGNVLSFCSNSVSCAVYRVDRSRDVEEGEIGKPQKFIDLVGSKNDGPDKQANKQTADLAELINSQGKAEINQSESAGKFLIKWQ